MIQYQYYRMRVKSIDWIRNQKDRKLLRMRSEDWFQYQEKNIEDGEGEENGGKRTIFATKRCI